MAVTVTYLGGTSFETLDAGTDFTALLPSGLAAPTTTQHDVLIAFALGRISTWTVPSPWASHFVDEIGTIATVTYDGSMTDLDVHMTTSNSSSLPTPGYVEGVGIRILAYRITVSGEGQRTLSHSQSGARTIGTTFPTIGSFTVPLASTLNEPTIPASTLVGPVSTNYYGFALLAFAATPDQRGDVDPSHPDPLAIFAWRDGVPLTAPTFSSPTPVTTGLALTPRVLADTQWGTSFHDTLGGGISQSPMRIHHSTVVTLPTAYDGRYGQHVPPFGTQYGFNAFTVFVNITETVQASVVPPTEECPDNLAAVVRAGPTRIHTEQPVVVRLPVVTVQAAAV